MFQVLARDGASPARRGLLRTNHAGIETPCFLPVGTRGAVKGVAFDRLEAWDCRAVLANTYHLMARPGIELIDRAGGLHAFIGWPRAILTDSGGFQVMSLSAHRRLTEEGVEFRAPEDGTRHFLTPERAMELQSGFGVDIAMALDVCPPFPAERTEVEEACRLTLAWAERSRRAYSGPRPALRDSAGRHARGPAEAKRRRARGSRFSGIRDRGRRGRRVEGGNPGASRASTAALLPDAKAALPDGSRHAGRSARLRALGDRPLRLRAADAQRPHGPCLHARRRDRDQARAIQGGSRAARPVVRLPGLPPPQRAPTCGISSSSRISRRRCCSRCTTSFSTSPGCGTIREAIADGNARRPPGTPRGESSPDGSCSETSSPGALL